jgi:uncharacterized protein with HEPN domain
MKKDDAVYLHHILAAIERIEMYSKGVPFQEFQQTGLLQDGVVRQLEIIGKAARNLSANHCRSYPEVPWSQIVGLRNRIAHAYFDIDLGIVWEIVQEALSPLKEQVKLILEEMKDRQSE